MQTPLKGAAGQVLGYIMEAGDRKTLQDPQGRTMGWYSKSQNRTYDRQGALVGPGEQLTILLIAT
jgi:hypothetical protein